MSSRDDSEKSYNVPLPDNSYITVYLRDSMTVEEFLASACIRKNLNPMEHFVRVKKRREMEDHNYFVPHRNDLIETYVSTTNTNEIITSIVFDGINLITVAHPRSCRSLCENLVPSRIATLDVGANVGILGRSGAN